MGDKPMVPWSDTDTAYIAGIVDGEGSIYSATTGATAYPAIVVAMTDRALINWLASQLGGAVQLHNQTNMRRHPNYRQQYRIGATGARAVEICRRLLPYLRVKGWQAALVVEFWTDGRRPDAAPLLTRHEERLVLAEHLAYANAGAR